MQRGRSDIPTAAHLVPARPSLRTLRGAASGCTACPLCQRATQTVFGEGSRGARAVLVGEEPGNDEDLSGHVFVGPAGRLLDQALIEAGIDRELVYLTNVVKHFKWKPRGKRRLHEKPNAREVAACRPWLEAELALIRPRVLVCLGATAAQAVLGRSFRVTEHRGQFRETALGRRVLATVHPASILRAPDSGARRRELRRFIADLSLVAPFLRG